MKGMVNRGEKIQITLPFVARIKEEERKDKYVAFVARVKEEERKGNYIWKILTELAFYSADQGKKEKVSIHKNTNKTCINQEKRPFVARIKGGEKRLFISWIKEKISIRKKY